MDERTIRNNNDELETTSRLGSSLDSTSRIDDAMDKTSHIDAPFDIDSLLANDLDITGRLDDVSGQQSDSDDDDVAYSDTFEIKGKIYKKIKCLSDNSGEAQVFLVESEGRELVLKIYYPNFTVKRKLMKIVANFNFEMIMNIFDYGKMYVEGVSRDYELMEYLKGGTLNNYHLKGDFNKFRRIALQCAAALAYCHNNNVIHKDIKPGNFFFRDEEQTQIVLGDFGISSIIKDKNEMHRTTQARTPIYASPEMYNDVIDGIVELTPATDYYSLGITLLALWLGNSPFNVGERTIMKRKNEGRLPGIDALPERVRLLISGLTAVNIHKRWGYEEVERWFLGESPDIDTSSPFLRYNTFVVDPERNLVAENVHELIPLLLDNERIAKGYLYEGRLTNWFETCGNSKMAMMLKDIVVNRYPSDQQAGLMAAVYAMDPGWPYVDVNGKECSDMHNLAITMLVNSSEYQMVLRNPNDRLWVYVESHSDCDVNRLRSYFAGVPLSELGNALLRSVYEIDKEMPFFTKHKSNTIKDIVHCFGYDDMTENDWQSVTDGRLLSWMYSHEDKMACEALRIMTEGQPYSRTLAYKVLYNLDRSASYDLRGADSPSKVGRILAEDLIEWQNHDDHAFADCIEDFSSGDGRFMYYAQLHGWSREVEECRRCFDLNSAENSERLGDYDLKTAAYRFCRILDTTPFYRLPSGKILDDGQKMDKTDIAEMRNEMRNGNLRQWMAAFFHENPYEDFSEEYSYEKCLGQWIQALGDIDPQQKFYRRFVKAKDETLRKYEEVRREYKRSQNQAIMLKRIFYFLAVLWALAVIIYGVGNPNELLDEGVKNICLPIGLPTALIVGVRYYFKGFGVMLSAFCAALGSLTSLVPLFALRFVNHTLPSMFIPAILVLSAIYVLACLYTDPGKEAPGDKGLMAEVMDDDMKSTLLEPLYYTFKTRAMRFKGSKFGILDEAKNQFKAASGDSVIHYTLWSVLAAVVLIDIVVNVIL